MNILIKSKLMRILEFFLILIVFMGFIGFAIAEDEVIIKDTKIETWPENEVSFGNWTKIMWTVCPTSQDDQRQPFSDPQTGRDVKYGQTLFELHITKPTGQEEVESIATDVANCQDEKQRTIHFNLPGVWKFFVSNKWYDGEKFYLAQSPELLLEVPQPNYFTTKVKPINLEMNAFGFHILDWGSKESILFSYATNEEPEKIHIAIMDQYGKNIRTIDSSSSGYLHAKFSPEGSLVFWVQDGNLFNYNLQTDEKRKLIEDVHDYDFLENDNGYEIVFLNGSEELMVFDGKTSKPFDVFDSSGIRGFDISPDGSKLLFKKTIDAGYGWADRVLAYKTMNGSEKQVPGASADCGADPKFSPSGKLVVFHTQSCGRGSPGGTIHISNLDGTINEILVPYRNINPHGFAVSPDGTRIIYDGDESDFEIMTLGNSVGLPLSNIVTFEPPLKQFNLGIQLNKIQCKDSLVLIERYDGSPACVKSDTVRVLIERGWTSSIAKVKTMPDTPPSKISTQIKDTQEHFSSSRVTILKGASSPENPNLKPGEITVVLSNNGTVTWINEDDVVHTIVSDDKSNPWSTGIIRPGESSSVTFNQTGIFTYHGEPGPWITGKIIVSFREQENLPKEDQGLAPIVKKAMNLGISNVYEVVTSDELSNNEKLEYIKAKYEEDGPVKTPSLNLSIRDLKDSFDFGEPITFKLIETGYAPLCTSPTLEVYLVKGERGQYDFSQDQPIYEKKLVYSCPGYDDFFPILNYWSEKDFLDFPNCMQEGVHIVVGDSGTELLPLEEYYCNP
jgi:plastocyanin